MQDIVFQVNVVRVKSKVSPRLLQYIHGKFLTELHLKKTYYKNMAESEESFLIRDFIRLGERQEIGLTESNPIISESL